MKNIIVITGGAGFVGSNLISFFLKKTKYQIISIDNYSSGNKKNHLYNKKVVYIKAHTKDISKVLNKYKKRINSIFHFGEFARISMFAFLKKQFFTINKSFTKYNLDDSGITSKYKKFSILWWKKRNEAFDYLIFLHKKLKIRFNFGIDFFITKLINFFI